MIEIKQIIKYSKKINVMYVEDDLDIQSEIKKILEIFFKSVVVANNGKEGFELFSNSEDIEIIISDIQMPIMDGLEMAKNIRQKDKDVKIVFMTAYNEQNYFVNSINIKVDKYILKPIEDDKLSEIIYELSKDIFEKKEYIKLKEKSERKKLKKKEKETVIKMSDAFIFPTIIFKDNELIYSSKSFKKLFKYSKIDVKNIDLNTEIFDKKKNKLTKLIDFNEETPLSNKVSIKQKVGKKVFKIVKKDIELDDSIKYIYVFVDITLEEYQKVKIQSYVKSLETVVVKNKKPDVLSDNDDNKLVLSHDKTQKLRKRHTHVMTSTEYLESLDSFVISELQELDDLDSDLKNVMFDFNVGDFSLLSNVSPLLHKYAKEIYVLEEFEDLYFSIKSLAELLDNVDISMIDENKYNEFGLYLKSIADDLALWRKSIFIDQNTDNIHYLDSSLFSIALHIEMLINGQDELDSDEDDLEFF